MLNSALLTLTSGVVPNTGLLPDVGENLEQFNCVGPMARFADDLPLMLNVLAGSATHGLRLNEKVNLKTLKLYYMETEGSVYISRVTTEARRAVRREDRLQKSEKKDSCVEDVVAEIGRDPEDTQDESGSHGSESPVPGTSSTTDENAS
ncbi:hypothetical protein HPB49_026527 [Dermacentor silvarum]|nr:hypothetical protein HPB49_026527 [Dermacentor silvarum]